MLKQILFAITFATTVIAAITPLTSSQLPANEKRKKKNGGNKRTKKRNGANRFIAINAIKKKDNNKKEAEARTFAEAIVIIAIVIFEASDIYKDDT